LLWIFDKGSLVISFWVSSSTNNKSSACHDHSVCNKLDENELEYDFIFSPPIFSFAKMMQKNEGKDIQKQVPM